MDHALAPGAIDLGEIDLGALLRDPIKALKDRVLQMAGFSNAIENKILDAVFGGTAFGGVTPLKLSLTTVAVTDTDDSTTITKATYTGYADINVANTDWNAASSGTKTNSSTLTFGACTAGSSTVIGFAVYNNSTHEIHMYGTVSSASVSSGITPSFGAGALSTSLD